MPTSQIRAPRVWPAVALCLFTALTRTLAPAASTGPSSPDALRERAATLDVARFASVRVGDRLDVPLFPDVTLPIEVTRVYPRPGGDITWDGVIMGESLGTCTVTVQGGQVCAGFWSQRGSFGIVPRDASAGREAAPYLVQLLSPDATRRCLQAQGAPGNAPGFLAGPPRIGSTPSTIATPAHGAPLPAPAIHAGDRSPDARACGCPDDQATVDVLCVYTTLAKNAAGGAAAIQTRVQNALDATNGAYSNSQINTSGVNRLQVRAAGFVEITYNEQSTDWLDHLIRVTDPDDGIMDQVQGLRDQYKADTVMLVVDDARFTGGTAWWAVWDEGQAYSCCNWRGLGGGSLLAAHELGHNFGCAHDHENDASAPFSYAWGHYFTVAATTYRTIMSYPGTVDLQYYSSPHLTHPGTGRPLGVPVGDPRAAYNALIIQQTRGVLSNYRDATRITDCNGNGIDDAIDISSGTSLDANGDCRPDECEVRRYADSQTPGPGEGTTWSNAGGDLRELLDLAGLKCSNIRQIWVADGVYRPDSGTADRYGNFSLSSGLTLYGGFQGKSRAGGGETSLAQRQPGLFTSTLSGEIGTAASDDNSYSVITSYGSDAHTLVDGFTITGGYSEWWGGGAYLETSSAHFSTCTFENNRAGGGGAVAAWTGGSPVFTACTFEGNQAASSGGGGLSANAGVQLTLDRCTFRNNAGYWGGASSVADSSADIRGAILQNNQATAYNGGALDIYNTQLTLANSLITGNSSASDGGAVWTASGTVGSIVNCTIADNTAATYTGGVVAYFDTLNISNTILWNNVGSYEAPQDRQLLYYGSTGAVDRSRVEGWDGFLDGIGSSGDDPYFADPGSGNYSLSSGSTSIDAGDASVLPSGIVLDAVGNPRRVDDPATVDSGPGPSPVIDIGALEFQPCKADFDGTGFVDTDDYDAFVHAFEAGTDDADFDGSGFVDTDDFDAFVHAFESGC